MIDLTKAKFIVTAWPDHRWPVQTIKWIHDLVGKQDNWLERHCDSLKKADVVCARNTAMQMCLDYPPEFEWFVFLDRDVRPNEHTKAFLELDTDVKCCQVEMYSKQAWSSPTAFHEAIWCTHKKVLEAIEPPWFEHRYNDSKTEAIGCICQSFRDKALEAGFTISHGGWAEHDKDGSWCG